MSSTDKSTDKYPAFKKFPKHEDFEPKTYCDDKRDYFRYRPWQQTFTNPNDDLWFYKLYNSTRNYPRLRYQTRKEMAAEHDSKSCYTFSRHPAKVRDDLESFDPILLDRPAKNPYGLQSYAHFNNPSYYSSNMHSFTSKPYYSTSSVYSPSLFY